MDAREKPLRVSIPDELRWLADHQQELEKEHPGEWLALKGYALIAVGNSLDEVMAEARQKGISDPLVTAVKRREFQGIPLIR
jgi:hypothetical protein